MYLYYCDFYVQMMNLIYGLNPQLGYVKPSCFVCMFSHFPIFVVSMKNISQSFALLGKIKLKTKYSRLKRLICIYLSLLKKLKGKSLMCINKLYVYGQRYGKDSSPNCFNPICDIICKFRVKIILNITLLDRKIIIIINFVSCIYIYIFF